MKLPVQITFRNLERSRTAEDRIHEEVAKLETFYDGLVSCRVTVALAHQHHAHGNPFHVSVDLTVPGEVLVVKHEPDLHSSLRKGEESRTRKKAELLVPHKDIYVALRDAFKKARRELQDYARRQRMQVKTHEGLPAARVSRLFLSEGYGFLETPDGRSVYFHRHSLVNGDLEELKVGSEVSFVEEQGEKGSQASTVKLRRRRRGAA